MYTKPDVYELISKQTSDPIVEWKTCRVSGTKFAIFQSDLEFYEKISPTFAGKTFAIPTPTLCPEERRRRRLSRRNLTTLYRRKCDAIQKDIISLYHPNSPFTVYDQKAWWSDTYNPLIYGRDFDFSKTFTEQFRSLQIAVPRISLLNGFNENALYANHSYHLKDCYLVFASLESEGCYYCDRSAQSNQCVDCQNIKLCMECYECIDLQNTSFAYGSISCIDCSYLYECMHCVGCHYCANCEGLVNQRYCIENQPVSKEEYEAYVLRSYGGWLSYQHSKQGSDTFHKHFPKASMNLLQTDNAFGNNLVDVSQSKFVFDCTRIRNSSYCTELMDAEDCMDYDVWGEHAQRVYDTHCTGGNVDVVLWSNVIRNGNNVLYSDNCLQGAQHCFGCIGLKQHTYCIFNKQYTKEDYEKLVAKIISHMQETGERGEFFDPSLSPFGYNETAASLSLPLDQKGAEDRGYRWSAYQSANSIPQDVRVICAKSYSDEEWDCLSSNDDIVHHIFICSVSEKPYRIIKQELEFYRKHRLPLPRKHPDVRHEERMKRRPGRTLYLRSCDQCGKEMLSVYEPGENKQNVYCEDCYQQEIYS